MLQITEVHCEAVMHIWQESEGAGNHLCNLLVKETHKVYLFHAKYQDPHLIITICVGTGNHVQFLTSQIGPNDQAIRSDD